MYALHSMNVPMASKLFLFLAGKVPALGTWLESGAYRINKTLEENRSQIKWEKSYFLLDFFLCGS